MDKITSSCFQIWRAFSRKKCLDVEKIQESQLKRCLSVLDLIALGVGTSLGAGVYVLIGSVARNLTGPSIIISFLIAAFASILAGLCYAEFAARVPKAGSAYVYSYVSIGEFWAYVIGWNMILENIIGVAASGKAWSQFVDAMFNDTIRKAMEARVKLSEDEDGWLDSYFDVLAMAFLLLVSLFSCAGVKLSSRVNLVFTLVNISMIICIVVVGFSKARLVNWTSTPLGFVPFGFRGVMAGAATCFYSFIGFDTIATSGEEAKNPTKHVPIAIVVTLGLCLVCFLGVGAVITLLVPWYTLAHTAALPKAFAQREVYGAEYAIAIGGVCGLTASALATIYPLPRNIYSMAQDGLLFSWLGSINKRTDVPLAAAVISGVLVALAALLLDLDSLIEMMSIGTLMAYTMVAIGVLVLHYQRESVGLTASDSFCKPRDVTNLPPASSADVATTSTNNVDNDTNNDKYNKKTPSRATQRHSIAASLFAPHTTLPRSTRLFSAVDTSRIALNEDTGLLKVGGDGGNKVRYVPTKTTTVVRRLKPRHEVEDSDNEEEGGTITPAITLTSTKESDNSTKEVDNSTKEHPIVEEYRSRVKMEQEQEKLQNLNLYQANNANQNTSQPFNQNAKQPTNQTTDHSTDHSTNQTTDHSTNHKTDHSTNHAQQTDLSSYQLMHGSQSSLDTSMPQEPTSDSRRKVITMTCFLVAFWVVFCLLSMHGPALLAPHSSASPWLPSPNETSEGGYHQPGKLVESIEGKEKIVNEKNSADGGDNVDNNKYETNENKDPASINSDAMDSAIKQAHPGIRQGVRWYILGSYVLLVVAVVACGVTIWRQPRNRTPLHFTTPLIPLVPILSILINIFLMFTLSDITWIRFTIWLAIGFVIYFTYGIWNSAERRAEDQEIILQHGPE